MGSLFQLYCASFVESPFGVFSVKACFYFRLAASNIRTLVETLRAVSQIATDRRGKFAVVLTFDADGLF